LDEQTLPEHFRFLVRVVNEQGELIDSDRDLVAIQDRLGSKAQRRFMDRQGQDFSQDGATDWTFGPVKPRVITADGITAWPALVDQSDTVGLRLFDTWEEAVLSHIDGVMRLLRLAIPDKLDYLAKHHGLSRAALIAWSPLDSTEQLVEDLLQRSLVDAAGDLSVIRDADSFETLCRRVRNEIGKVCLERSALLNEIIPRYSAHALVVFGKMEERRPDVFDDLSSQLEDLIYPGFLLDLEAGRLEHYPRYMKAIGERLVQLEQDPGRDAQRLAKIAPWWNRYREALYIGAVYDEAMDDFRWLLEEFRVSLFAQKLGTACKVSEKRLSEAWKATGC